MRICSLVILSLLWLSCNKSSESTTQEGKVLATVYDESLMDYEIKSLIPQFANATDSINISNAYIEQWIRESLILHEAKKDVPPDIDKLVEDYRSSLLKVHYENKVIDSNLDSTISDSELDAFYQAHKSEYLLKEKAISLFIIKTKEDAKINTDIERLWKEEDLGGIAIALESNGGVIIFEENIWNKISDLSKTLSRKMVKRIENNEGNRFSTTEDGFKYFIKVLDIKSKNDIPPFSVIDNQLRKVILHQRKKKILNQYTEDLYEREARKKSIKTYIES